MLGARLTNSQDMQRGERRVMGEMTRMGLVNVAAEPYMDYGVDLLDSIQRRTW